MLFIRLSIIIHKQITLDLEIYNGCSLVDQYVRSHEAHHMHISHLSYLFFGCRYLEK